MLAYTLLHLLEAHIDKAPYHEFSSRLSIKIN